MIPLPKGLPVCRENPDRHDHGLALLMNAADRGGCDDLERHRYVSAFGDFNTIYSTLDEFARDECPIPPGHAVRAGPGIKGWPSLTCRTDRSDGWVDVEVFALTGSSPKDKTPSGVDYSFTLHTTRERLRHDLRTFRQILAGARLWRTTVPWTPSDADPPP